MTARLYLGDEQLAGYYVQANGPARPGEDALDLEPRVLAWLSRANMGHRSALKIAIEVVKLRPEPAPAPIPAPEAALWEHHMSNGIGDRDPLAADQALAAHIQSLSLAEWARERVLLGLAKNLVDFLGGA
jgi:hypothetical protein